MSFQTKITKEQLPNLAGIAFSKNRERQQQTASPLAKELQHRICNNNSLDDEDDSFEEEDRALGSFEAQPQATTSLPAWRFPKQNNNTSILGQDLKNKAAWGILIDTGAAISLAPMSFAPTAELSPLQSTFHFQLRTITGTTIEAFGRRTVQLVGSELCLHVSFVIANVEHALIGMDILMPNQLSLIRTSFNEYYLVNATGAKTQLQPRGHHLYLEACPEEFGLTTCRGSSFQEQNWKLTR